MSKARIIFTFLLLLSAKICFALSVSLTSVNPSCYNSCNGTITAIASGGTSPYQYSIDGGITWQSSGLFSGLCAGNYTITAMDAVSAIATASTTLNQPSPVIFTLSGINCSAWNLCDGQIIINASGGVPPYTYYITSSSGTTSYSATPVTGLCAGTYPVSVGHSISIANNCPGFPNTVPPTITITAPAPPPGPLSANITPGPWVCPYTCQTATLSASGGTAPYQYSFSSATGPWSSSAVSGCKSGGSVTGWVKDANGQVVSATAVTNWPPPFVANSVASGPSHCGYDPCDGMAAVAGFGGVPPYSGGDQMNGNVAIHLHACPGIISYGITDANGCAAWTPVGVGILSLTVTATTTPSCSPCNGTITATPGFPPLAPAYYQYSLNNFTTIQTSPVFTGLCTGTYTVYVRAMTPFGPQCNASVIVTVGSAVPAIITTSSISPICNANCNGSMNAVVSPSGTYQYSINGGNTWQSSSSFTNLCAGSYTVTTSSSTSCITNQTFTITSPPAITYSVAARNNVSCYGSNNGSVSLSVTGGTGTFSYNWTPGNPTGDGTPNVSGLSPGTWTCTITDGNACTVTQTVSITQPPQLVTSLVSYSPISCNGGNNGSVSINASGGTGILNYNWTPGNPIGDGTNSISSLNAGSWICTVTDANGCISQYGVNLTQPSPISSTISSNPVSCNGGSNGTATVTASGGTGTKTYNWNPGNPIGDGTPSVSGLTAGTWSCTISDANGCVLTSTINITEPAVLNASVSSFTNVSCNSGNNGSATISATGGTGIYAYNWSPSVGNTATVNGLIAGNYSCIVTDQNGCAASTSLTITQPVATQLNASTANPICYGSCNGTINANASPSGTYLFSIDGGNTWQSSGAFTNLCAGTYTVTSQNSVGCMSNTFQTLTNPPQVQATAIVNPPTCNGICNGTVFINANPSGTYQYSFNLGNTWQNDNFVDSICDAGFNVIVENINGCRDTILGLYVLQPPAINYNALTNDALCFGNCNGTIHILPGTGPNRPYIFSSDNGNTWQNDSTFNSVCAGVYFVAMRDAIGCELHDTVLVQEPAALITTATAVSTNCNLCNGAGTIFPSGGTSPYSYNWIDFGGPSPGQTLCAGNYTIIISDANSCSDTVIISVPSSIGITIDSVSATGTPSSFYNGTATVFASGNPPLNYQWDATTGNQVTQTAINLLPGNYCVNVIDSLGCIDSVCITVPVITGTTNLVEANPIQVYPNPFEDEIFISGNGTYHISITDISGKQIADLGMISLSASGKKLELPEELASGIYFVRAENADGWRVMKLVRE